MGLYKLTIPLFGFILITCLNTYLMPSDFMESISTDRATITTLKPVDFQIDGEYCGALTEVIAEIVSKKLRVAMP